MNELTTLLPLVTGLVGWLLNEVSHRRRETSADRRAISKALADLLEIRHQTLTMKSIFDAVNRRWNLPQDAWSSILPYLDKFLPNTDNLHTRYNEAVDSVSSANPLLGFRLRSKDEFTRFLALLRQMISQDAKAVSIWPQFESILIELSKSPLDQMILELAQSHGFWTWWKIRKYLKKPIVDQKDFDEYFTKVELLMAAASQQTSQKASSGA